MPTDLSNAFMIVRPLSPVLAQDGGAGRPTDAASPPVGGGTTAAPGTAAPGQPSGPFSDLFFPMLLGFVLLMIVISITGARREKKRHEAMVSSIRKHDRVQTRGGIIGSVADLKGETIVLKVDESTNTRITFHRSAIAHVMTADHDTSSEEPTRS